MSAASAVFVIASLWVVYAFVGYPILMLSIARFWPKRGSRSDGPPPPVTVIVAVHNGAAHLASKLENLLAQEYAGELELLVTSDGSTDETESIAETFAGRGVVLVASATRGGKESAQARAVEKARGDVLVFTDVTAHLEAGAIEAILAPFADAGVGAVSSEDEVDSEEGEGLYVRYEMALRRAESAASTLIGLSGSFFAIRRELADPWPIHLASDFRMGLECARRGWRAVSEPDARARFTVVADTGAEWRRKVRTIRRGIAVLLSYTDLLHPRFGRVAFTLWGHKVARFTAPFAMLAALGSSVYWAAESWLGVAALASQGAVYGLGVAALVSKRVARSGALRALGFFLLVNAATLVAWLYHASGQRAVTWQPTRR